MPRNIIKSNNAIVAVSTGTEAFSTDTEDMNLFNAVQNTSFAIAIEHQPSKQIGTQDFSLNDVFIQPDVELTFSYYPEPKLENEVHGNFIKTVDSYNNSIQAFSGTLENNTNFYLLNNPDQELDTLNLINLKGAGSTTNYTVTVQSVGGGNRYFIDGVQQPTLELTEGNTYVFDWSAATSHPVRFSTTSDGTHGGGSEYTVGVTKDDGNHKTTIVVADGAPTLYYYCQYHAGMGGQANTPSAANNLNNFESAAFGNCFLNSYGLTYGVDSLPTVTTSYICSNMKFEGLTGTSMTSPAINLESGNANNVGRARFMFITGTKNPVLVNPKNSDSTITLQNLQAGGQNLSGIHFVQSLDLSVALQRTSSYGLGSDHAYNRKAQMPAQGTFNVSSLVSGYDDGTISGILANETDYTFDLVLDGSGKDISYSIDGAKLESFNYSLPVNGIMTFNASFTFEVTEKRGLRLSGTYYT